MFGTRQSPESKTLIPVNTDMRKAAETTLRHLATLAAIPVSPKSRSTRDILEVLKGKNPAFDVDIRSIQRSLGELSRLFPITSDTQGRSHHWSWTEPDALTQIPTMSDSTAFVLCLASEYLRSIMPPATLRVLDPHFRHARRILNSTTLRTWPEQAVIIARGPALTPPDIPAEVQESVFEALIGNRKIQLQYRGKHEGQSREIVLNPLGIVCRTGILYLVATSWGYQDVRHYVLHRMSAPRVMDEPAEEPPSGFRLSDHLANDGSFAYPAGDRKIPLQVLFHPEAGAHLTESRLALDHRATLQEDGRLLVEATVADTGELRWWLAGFGSLVEVLGPATLRDEFREEARQLVKIYGKGGMGG